MRHWLSKGAWIHTHRLLTGTKLVLSRVLLPLIEELLILLGLIDQTEVLLAFLVSEADVEDWVALCDVCELRDIHVLIDKCGSILVVSFTFTIQVEDSLHCLPPSHVLDEAASTESFVLIFEQVELLDITEGLEQISHLLLIESSVHVRAVQF